MRNRFVMSWKELKTKPNSKNKAMNYDTYKLETPTHYFDKEVENESATCDLCLESFSSDDAKKVGDYKCVCPVCVEFKEGESVELFEEQSILQCKIFAYYKMIEKAIVKRDWIAKSNCIQYSVFGGGIQRAKDLANSIDVVKRLMKRVSILIVEEKELEAKIGFE